MPLGFKRFKEWCRVLSLVGEGAPLHWRIRAYAVAVFKMMRALASGIVPRSVWRQRMRICHNCPIYDRELKACRQIIQNGTRMLGCGCFTPYQALTRAPYQEGCWVRTVTENEGWPAYHKETKS